MAVQLREGLLREAFSVLRDHGAGRNECVVYLAGPAARPGVVDEVLHPVHQARPNFYEVDGRWLTDTWIDLAARRREIRVQVHTHGGAASHSKTDDNFPVIQTPGFLSLVLPGFAMGPVGLDGAYLAELDAQGQWHERAPEQELIAA